MQDNILVSYSCTHFAVLPADISRENYDWLFNHLQSAAETDLISRRITSHLAIPHPCPTPACQTFRLQPWTEIIRTAESEIHAALIETRETYMRYGKDYHLALHPLSRARRLEDPECALAHKQFTLESRSFHNDPFFMPWRALHSGYTKIKAATQNPYSLLPASNAKRIAKTINDCRFEISKIEYLLNQLYDGLNAFRTENRSLQNDKNRRRNIVVARGLPLVSSSQKSKLKCFLERLLDESKLSGDGLISISMPLDESTGETTGLAFIEFQTSKQARFFTDVTTGAGGVPLDKKHLLGFTRLIDVSRLKFREFNDFRNADMIPSRSQGAIDEMLRHIRQKSKEESSHEDKKADCAKMNGSTLQEHLAKRKTAELLHHRMDRWGTKLSDNSDVNGDTRHLRHAVFRNAAHQTWLKRIEGFAELIP